MNKKPLTAEQLAKEMHATFNTVCAGRSDLKQWNQLAPCDQEKYRGTARLLLAKYEVRQKPAPNMM